MKGMSISDIITTALLLAIISIIISVMLLVNVVNQFSSEPAGYVIAFVKYLNDPFQILEALSHKNAADRQVFEKSLESIVTDSLEMAKSTDLQTRINEFIKNYKLSVLIVELKGKKTLFKISNIEGEDIEAVRCGDGGFCTDKVQTAAGDCQVGKVKIDDGGACKPNQICCQLNPEKYAQQKESEIFNSGNKLKAEKFDIVSCGRNNVGICNPPESRFDEETGRIDNFPYCGNGFVQIEDIGEACKKANSQTPICCALAESIVLEKARITSRAEVPFLYKGKILFEQKEYQCQDSRTEICNGEYARGLCPGPDYVKCCITDAIRCKRPDTNYFCRDSDHCPVNGGDIIIKDNQCPDPDKPGQQSNYECCTIDKPYNENEEGNNAGKVAFSGKYGSCYLTGITYTDEPLVGKLEVSSG